MLSTEFAHLVHVNPNAISPYHPKSVQKDEKQEYASGEPPLIIAISNTLNILRILKPDIIVSLVMEIVGDKTWSIVRVAAVQYVHGFSDF